MHLQPPTVLEIESDVSSLDSTTGNLKTTPCAGLLMFQGAFTDGLEVSFNNRANFFPIRDMSTFPVPAGQNYWVRQTTPATGSLQISIWPVNSDAEAIVNANLAPLSAGVVQDPVLLAATGTSGAGAADTITLDAVASTQLIVTGAYVFTEDAVLAADILVELEDGSTPIWQGTLGSGAPRGSFCGFEGVELPITIGAAANLQISGDGGTAVTRSSLVGKRIPL